MLGRRATATVTEEADEEGEGELVPADVVDDVEETKLDEVVEEQEGGEDRGFGSGLAAMARPHASSTMSKPSSCCLGGDEDLRTCASFQSRLQVPSLGAFKKRRSKRRCQCSYYG